MTYEEALEYIHGTYKFGVKLGLENIKRLLELMGNPQKDLKIIHVAGTNGKGSTCAFINQVLIEAGYKVGLYTSPYLEFFNERMKINNIPISNDELARITKFVKDKVELMIAQGFNHPTEFEIVTAIAFEYFKRMNVDFVVLEVGLGGRFDATNVVETPELCIITSIGYDHMDILGQTIEQIAYEKAGIIKEGSTVILGLQRYKEPTAVISNVCKQKNAKLIEVKSDYKIISNTLDGVVFDCITPRGIYKNLEIKLLGEHQVENALNCVYAFEYLSERFNIGIDALVVGLLNTKWNGRFEIISKAPLVILDGAHNVDGMKALVENCKQYLKGKKISIVVGVLKDKEYQSMLSLIKEITSDVIFTLVPYQKRAFSTTEAKEVAMNYQFKFIEDFREAINISLEKAKEDSAILICGSLYLVGPARTYLKSIF
ncbi:bifunctional folylpolyglutamate synthase/dihydrofolate synthase [Caldicellulosiruptor naganoensis]|uniref:tetrahydrofolate synthase n=2 Tax=Caldicellulosiruptor naganoensis TaxID=29324 RepID=A0ABY7BMS0_9FIRM|nr:folylpolyglutamate synthase/dihydrofolate synthase family protein [Caldicellulosiruptor naganoensis]WAM32694.1 bifunctional folylpolyglutamate synthase/dihydrofolate synthase [Caldicellulosiruptor naganoensis]